MSIIYLPVDERFCTRDYFLLLSNSFDIKIKTPPKALLGSQKIPGDVTAIYNWLLENTDRDDVLIVSLDTLLYGGLISSRIDRTTEKTLSSRLNAFLKIAEKAKKTFLTSTVMRIPRYNSDIEEPVYYDYFGEKIHLLTKKMAISLTDREVDFNLTNPYLNLLNTEDFKEEKTTVPQWMLEDYFTRRVRNLRIIQKVIHLINEGHFEFFNLTLDDNGKDSLNLFEAKQHKALIRHLGVGQKCSVHPGADEAALTLLSRILCEEKNFIPEIQIIYNHPDKRSLIPPYEGDPLDLTIANHIRAAGGKIAECSDIKLLVNNMEEDYWIESPSQSEHHLINVYDHILKYLDDPSSVLGIADIRFPNGADRSLIDAFLKKRLDWKKVCYAGWNTPSNTLGTTLTHLILLSMAEKGFLKINQEKNEVFQKILLLENYAYQSDIRQKLFKWLKEKTDNYKEILLYENEMIEMVTKELELTNDSLSKYFSEIGEINAYFPWHRLFEIAITVDL